MTGSVNFALGYQHPGTIVLVDDHESFLRNLEMSTPRTLLSNAFDDPGEAADFLNDSFSDRPPLLQKLLSYHSDYGQDALLKVNIGLLEQAMTNADRFQTPTVLITDYSMPAMDGLELCRRVQDQAVKKILLTGYADEKLGIEAFNDGLIDRFVVKDHPKAVEVAFSHAVNLHAQYFCDMQNGVFGGSNFISQFFADSAAISRLGEFREEHGYLEHYLTTEPFGYYLVDSAGSVGRLAIYSDLEIDQQLEMASTAGAPAAVLAALRSKAQALIPYEELSGYPVQQYPWEEFMFPAERFSGATGWHFVYDGNAPVPADYSADVCSFDFALRNS